MKIAVSVESTCDLTKELIEKYDISVIPYHVTLGEDTYSDGQVSINELFEFTNKTGVLPKTNALNEFEYTEYFETLKKEYDAVVHICLSSGLSSSCNNAIRASKSLENVYVVDSLSLSTGIGMLAIYARELADLNLDALTVYEKVNARVEKLSASFIVERLDYLCKGGRCSALALLGANVFRIRPRLVLKDGVIKNDKKYRGNMGSVIEKYAQELLLEYDKPDLDKAFITYTTATDEMIEAAKTVLTNAGFKNIYCTVTGATVASHCGQNTLGIMYFNDVE